MKKRFEFYAYNPPMCGTYYVDGVAYRYGEDFRNVDRYKEYLDCGFTMMQVRYENAYDGEEWETSNTKRVCDVAYKAGVRKLKKIMNKTNFTPVTEAFSNVELETIIDFR